MGFQKVTHAPDLPREQVDGLGPQRDNARLQLGHTDVDHRTSQPDPLTSRLRAASGERGHEVDLVQTTLNRIQLRPAASNRQGQLEQRVDSIFVPSDAATRAS